MVESVVGFVIAVWLLVSIGVSLDANKNSPQSGFLWGLAVFVGGFLGIILYFLLGRDPDAATPGDNPDRSEDLIECPNCRSVEQRARSYCRFCEKPLHEG